MNRLARWLAAASLALVAQAHGAPVADDGGRVLDLRAPPRRVIALAPNLTELVHAVGAGDRLIAVDESSNFPPAAKRLQRVSDHQRLDVERIVALQPDLVLVWKSGNTMRELAQLEAAGIPLFRLEPRRLDDIALALERIGTLLGRADAGRDRARALRAEIAALRARYVDAVPVSVFYQVWPRPLLTLNGEHLVSDVLALCGGRNVFADLRPLVPQLSTESVAVADPQAMLTARDGADPAQRTPDAPAFAEWGRLRSIAAVQRGALYTVPADIVVRAGPRIADGAREVCRVLDEVRQER
jgi:iron complex transport system substrate-binding protein